MSFLHLDSWNQVSKLRIGPSPGNKNRAAVSARIPVKFGTDGEGKVGKSKRGLSCTCRCAWLDGRWPEEAGLRRRMAGGSSARRRRLYRGEGVGWPGLGAARE